MNWVCEEVVRHLQVEPEWTVVESDGVGFVAGQLGVWLAIEPREGSAASIRVEVRLARCLAGVASDLLLDSLNATGAVGCWIYDPASQTIAATAGLDLDTPPTETAVRTVATVVSYLVVRAEDLAGASVAERELGGIKALTLIAGRRRTGEHPFLREHLFRCRSAGAEPGAAVRVLPLVQDGLLYLTPGWYVEHDERHSRGSDGHGRCLNLGVGRHRALGWGLAIAASSERHQNADPSGSAEAQRLNQLHSSPPGWGAWSTGPNGPEYRIFLPNSLLEVVEKDLPQPRLISGAVLDALNRTEPGPHAPALDRTTSGPLIRPRWGGDEEAEGMARREPINDGPGTPDGYVWIDSLGRAATTTEESFRIWRSRLLPADLDSPSVVGFSQWFEREVNHRRGRFNAGPGAG